MTPAPSPQSSDNLHNLTGTKLYSAISGALTRLYMNVMLVDNAGETQSLDFRITADGNLS